MKEGYRLLGEYIRQVDVRNTEGKEDNLLGVSVQKQFISSIANTVGTDFTKYKVVKKGQFTYIPVKYEYGNMLVCFCYDIACPYDKLKNSKIIIPKPRATAKPMTASLNFCSPSFSSSHFRLAR